MILFKNYKLYFTATLFFFLLLSNTNIYAQCAGTDTTITICNKDLDANNKTYDLFAQLGDSPTTGGTWSTTNPANFVALNASTGIVNLWRINNSGIHLFTYTNNCSGTVESATITVNLGGYAGENNIDGSANACSDDSSVNLHGFLGSQTDEKVQDFNGVWQEVPIGATNLLADNIFNAMEAGPGVYTFTYTVPDVDTCPSRQSTVILEVHPSPDPGESIPFIVCTNAPNLSDYNTLNLRDYLNGQKLQPIK